MTRQEEKMSVCKDRYSDFCKVVSRDAHVPVCCGNSLCLSEKLHLDVVDRVHFKDCHGKCCDSDCCWWRYACIGCKSEREFMICPRCSNGSEMFFYGSEAPDSRVYACNICGCVIVMHLKTAIESNIVNKNNFDPLLFLDEESLDFFSSLEEFLEARQLKQITALIPTQTLAISEECDITQDLESGLVDVQLSNIEINVPLRIIYTPYDLSEDPFVGSVLIFDLLRIGPKGVDVIPNNASTADFFEQHLDDGLIFDYVEEGQWFTRLFAVDEILGGKDFGEGELRFFLEPQESSNKLVKYADLHDGVPKPLIGEGFRRIHKDEIHPGLELLMVIYPSQRQIRRREDIRVAVVFITDVYENLGGNESGVRVARLRVSDRALDILRVYHLKNIISTENVDVRVDDFLRVNTSPDSGLTLVFLICDRG